MVILQHFGQDSQSVYKAVLKGYLAFSGEGIKSQLVLDMLKGPREIICSCPSLAVKEKGAFWEDMGRHQTEKTS